MRHVADQLAAVLEAEMAAIKSLTVKVTSN